MKGQMKCHRIPFIIFVLLCVISTSAAVGCGGSSTPRETDPAFQAGYLKASREMIAKVAEAKTKANTSFDEGYAVGYEEGKNVGYAEGYNEGNKTSKVADSDEIYEEGFEKGRELGYAEGLQSGYLVGYENGAEASYLSGYQDGYDACYAQNTQSGTNE